MSSLHAGGIVCAVVTTAIGWGALCGRTPAADEPLASSPRAVADRSSDTDGRTRTSSDGAAEAPIELVSHETSHVVRYAIDQAHAACFVDDPFPSAKKCGTCHPDHFREWSVSPHSYAQLSPVFNAMSNRLIELTNGTTGDFCIRCHTPTGMALNEPINTSNLCRAPTSREGITCVVCHRINQAWGKGAGRQALVAGDIHQVVYGPVGNQVLSEVLANPEYYGVLKTAPAPDVRGRDIHADAQRFFQLTTSGFCGACHDVFAPNGFRLEDAFSEFKSSRAALEEGRSCQDCHMGIVPGDAQGYAFEPAARIGNVVTPPRKRTNHMMIGPDYSIIHPGLYPHHMQALHEPGATLLEQEEQGLATMAEWLQFNVNAGWGSPQFEDSLPEGYHFPPAWQDSQRRRKARRILDEQFELLGEAAAQRLQLLRTGYQLGNVEVTSCGSRGLRFRVLVSNGTTGHGVPTGFDAERVVFLRVLVWNEIGRLVFQSGDLDPNGDVRDSHSYYVHNNQLPLDRQLFSLQTRFITRNIRGGEREQVLNVPFSLDPLPYIRPATRPFTVLGRPIGARKQKQNLEVDGHRWAEYEIPRRNLTSRGPYTIRVQLIAGMVPVNLVHEISDVGFDYGMSAAQVANNVVAGHLVVHERTATIRRGQ
jgi:Cytochrome c554 and c-prime